MSHVSIRTGSEGPRHDPYGYEEIKVVRPNGDTIVIHSGLGYWCQLSRDSRSILFSVDGPEASNKMFETYAGCAPEIVSKAFRSLPVRRARQHPCRPRDFICVEGYPGETFTICRHCNEPVDYHFNQSAVE